MKPNPIHRLPAPLEAAVQRLKLAAREAAERTIESLGLAALAATHAFQRDGLLAAQFELNRKSAVFVLTFNDAFDDRIVRELGPRLAAGSDASPAAPAATNWDTLSLVEDREVEAQISAERFGLDIAVACEWELRELDAYVGALLTDAGGEAGRNPLRPDIVGHAMIRGIEAVSDHADVRKVLASEMSRSLSSLLRTAYASIVSDWRNAGLRPLGLAVRMRTAHDESLRDSIHGGSAFGAHDDGHSGHSGHSGHAGHSTHGSRGAGRGGSRAGALDSRYGSRHGAAATGRSGWGPSHGGTPLGHVDPAMMSLIRRLAHSEPAAFGVSGHGGGYLDYGDGGAPQAPLPNLIRAHREELRQAATGSVDHMVIDVIGFLFDQILADPKVPPQMARLIARLQLPVLRAALGDPGFFASHRHPVRRFVNRIASLGAGFEDFSEAGAKNFLAKVKALVQQVVEGDFDQIETYEQKLAALEAFVAEQAAQEVQAQNDAATLVSAKEDEARLRELYAQRLAGDLKDVEAPAFLREFVSRVWSQVLLRAAAVGGADSEQVRRLRRVGSELFMSVHPKATPAQRKAFLADLPRLMQALTEGMNLIAWPEARRRAFFGQLMPAHAEALKSTTGRPLDFNLMARKVEGALERPAPSREELTGAKNLPVLSEEIVPASFSADEARRIGLVDEAAVDWAGKVEPAPEAVAPAEPEPADAGPPVPGLPTSSEPPEPTEGRALADAVQIGFAYQMHLDDTWHKVRLSHVSPGRSFFIFTHGGRHKKTVSLTQRMLVRLCETGRLKAYESATLIERATARARRQLSALSAAAGGAARA